MSTQVDPIEELRLRRQAREIYVPADDRDESWHPVILQEMLCRDEELREMECTRTPDVVCESGSVDLTQWTHNADLCGASRH